MAQNLRDMWQRVGLVQRIVLLAIVLGCLGVGAVLVAWARKPSLALLYSGLSAEEAAKIVEKIRDADVPYELRSGGTAVYVPEDKVYSMRLAMASQSLPSGEHAGYRILDDEKIGISPFAQHVNYVRAVEGELARTIQLLDGVASARVHVVRPEGSLFAGREKESSATVVVRLKPGRNLTGANVAAIVHLLAGSVEGLTPRRVVVVDGQGKLLSGEADNELAKKAGTFLDYKTQVEEYLSRKGESLLAAVLGSSRASVSVDAVIETSSVSQTMETYDPNKRVVTKEEIKSRSSVPGAAAPAAGGGETKEETSINEYLVTRTLEQRTDLPGKVKSLTVAAFVDLSGPPKDEKSAASAAPQVALKDVEDILRSAMGLQATDTLKVVNTPFHRPAPPPPAEPAGEGSKNLYLEIAKRGSLGLLVVGVLVAMKVLGGPRKKGAAMQPALEGQVAGAPGNLLPGAEAGLDPELLKARITHALQNNPEEVKRLFLSWVESEKAEA